MGGVFAVDFRFVGPFCFQVGVFVVVVFVFSCAFLVGGVSLALWEGRVLLAMTLSLFTCGFIIVLDKVEDALREDGEDKLYKLVK